VSSSIYRKRIAKVRRSMAAEGVEALLVTRLANIRYLTAFTGSSALVVLGPGFLHFLTDGRYRIQAVEQVGAADVGAEITVYGNAALGKLLRDLVRSHEISMLHVEAESTSWSMVLQLRRWLSGTKLQPSGGIVERVRASKDAEELAALSKAASVTSAAFKALLGQLRPGMSEIDVARLLEDELQRRGSEGWAFDPIVAAGPRGALPHARPSVSKIRKGDVVVIDFGCRVDGYCSDMTRTVAVGNPPAELVQAYKAVKRANELARAEVAAGRSADRIDAAAREWLTGRGYGSLFVHSTGHGLGLEVHEWPRIGRGASDRIPLNCVLTIEPGCYIPGLGGVRIEDMVVAERGGSRLLTKVSRELVVL
jgi:Xaa-Pro aminopeptidase